MQGNRSAIGQKHLYEHVPKSEETSQEGKVTILWNQQYKLTELFFNFVLPCIIV